MEQRLTMVTLGVRDLARARKFYEEGLGWALGSGVEGQVAFYQLGGMLLGLYGLEALAEDAQLALPDLQPGRNFGGAAAPLCRFQIRPRSGADVEYGREQIRIC